MELTLDYPQLDAMARRLGWAGTEVLVPNSGRAAIAFQSMEYAVHEAAHRVLLGADLRRLSDTSHTDTLIKSEYQTVYGMDQHEIQASAVTYLVTLEMFRGTPAESVLQYVAHSAKSNTKTQSWTEAVCKERILASTKSRVTQRAAKYILRIAEGT